MANTLITKNSSSASNVPTAGELSEGELAVNTADGRLWSKTATTVFELTDHDNLTNYVAGEHFLQSAITTVGTIGTGVWQGTAINQTYLVGQSGTNTGDNSVNTLYSGLVSDTGEPATLRSGGTPTLNTGVTAAEMRSLIGAGTSSTTGTVTNVNDGNGMTFTAITGTGDVTMGTPGTLTGSTSNGVTTNSHTHAITTSGSGAIMAVNGATLTGQLNCADFDLNRPVLEDYAIKHTAPTVSGNAVTVNCVNGNSFAIDMDPATAAVTLTLSNPPASGRYGEVNLHITMGTPAYDITWPGTVTWQGGSAPTLTSSNNVVDLVHLFTINGGTNWYGTFALAAAAAGGGSTTLSALTDVTITSVADDNFLIYDSGTAQWRNYSISGDIDINDVGVATAQSSIISGRSAAGALISTDDFLVLDGGVLSQCDVGDIQTYMQANLTFGDIGDGTITNSMLRWSGSAWVEEDQVQCSGAGIFYVRNTARTDYAAFSHDGTDFNTAHTLTTDWNITGLTGVLNVGSGVTVTGTMGATTVTGANVTSGANPGHTHTGSSISGLATGDITSGTFSNAFLASVNGTVTNGTHSGTNTGDNPGVTAVNNGNGMNFTNITTSGTVTMGTPGSITDTSTNAVQTSSHTHAVSHTGTGSFAMAGSPTFTTKINTPYMEATALGPNSDPGADDAYFGGYGILASRAAMYISNNSGSVNLNYSALHGSGIKLATTSGGVTVTGNIVVTGTVDGKDVSTLTSNTGTVTAVNNGNGMNFTNITTSGTVTMGTPGTLTGSTTNAVQTSSHTHAITTTGTGSIAAQTSPSFTTKITTDKVFINESASATTDVAGDGQIWVKNNVPNDLYYTADNGIDYPIAYATYRRSATNTLDNINQTLNMTTDSVADALVNGIWGKTVTTAYTLTLEPSTDTQFQVGAQLAIYNAGASGNLTVTEGSGTTLNVLTGTAKVDAAGSATVGPGGYATLIRESATGYLLMGAGITP